MVFARAVKAFEERSLLKCTSTGARVEASHTYVETQMSKHTCGRINMHIYVTAVTLSNQKTQIHRHKYKCHKTNVRRSSPENDDDVVKNLAVFTRTKVG